MKTTDVRKEGRGTCRAVGKDMDFISDAIRAKRTSASTLFYYESRKRKLKIRLIYEYRCDERLKI